MQALYRVVPDVIVLPFLVGVCSAHLDSYGTKLILVLHIHLLHCLKYGFHEERVCNGDLHAKA